MWLVDERLLDDQLIEVDERLEDDQLIEVDERLEARENGQKRLMDGRVKVDLGTGSSKASTGFLGL